MHEQNDLGPSAAGSVMADIGGDRGALVLYSPASLLGAEIEVSPAAGGLRTHVAVRERRAGDKRVFAAFYPALAAGDYVVWGSATTAAGTVTVTGGAVAEASIARGARAGGAPSFSISHPSESPHARRPVGDIDRPRN